MRRAEIGDQCEMAASVLSASAAAFDLTRAARGTSLISWRIGLDRATQSAPRRKCAVGSGARNGGGVSLSARRWKWLIVARIRRAREALRRMSMSVAIRPWQNQAQRGRQLAEDREPVRAAVGVSERRPNRAGQRHLR